MAMLQPTVRRQDTTKLKKTRKVTDLGPGHKMQLIRQPLQHLNLTKAIVTHPSANKSGRAGSSWSTAVNTAC